MCGIVGAFYFERTPKEFGAQLGSACGTLLHRGNDAVGIHLTDHGGIACQRLSILDREEGHQPLFNEDKTIALVANGEVYDHSYHRMKLESLGHNFRSNSDMEVVVHLYEELGEEVFAELNGMFAIALWDLIKERVYIARDRCGIKPLYYLVKDRSFVFASEIKALFEFDRTTRSLCPKSLVDYLTFQFVLEDRTLFHDVKKLLPAHYLVCDRAGLRLKEYWTPSLKKVKLSPREASIRYGEILNRSVSRQLRSDVPVGFHLSGGVDTAAIVQIAESRIGRPLYTISSGFQEGGIYNEQLIAQQYAKLIGAQHETVTLTESMFFDLLLDVIWHMDEPAGDAGVVAQFATNRVAARNVKVVFSGQGADEIAAGYVRHLLFCLACALNDAILNTNTIGLDLAAIKNGMSFLASYQDLVKGHLNSQLFRDPAESYLHFLTRLQSVQRYLKGEAKRLTKEYSPTTAILRELKESFDGCQASDLDALDYALWFDFRYMLPPLLHMEDRASMAYAVEARVPFLDHELVEFTFSVPTKAKLHKGIPKFLLRSAMKGRLPDHIVTRPEKVGRPTPFNIWSKSQGSFTRNILLSEQCLDRGLFQPKAIKDAFEHVTTFDRSLWALLNVELWHRVFVD